MYNHVKFDVTRREPDCDELPECLCAVCGAGLAAVRVSGTQFDVLPCEDCEDRRGRK